MANDGFSSRSQEYSLRLKWAGDIVLRSGAIGLLSGGVLGALFGSGQFAFFGWQTILACALWTGAIGAGLGLSLGLVNGLLLGLLSCLFFYPLQYVRLYRMMAKIMSVLVAAGGTISFGPWYFSSKAMTPSSAVLIGFSSVLASVISGWAGWLAGQNTTEWYEQQYARQKGEPTAPKTPSSTTTTNPSIKTQSLKTTLRSMGLGWVYVSLFSLLCSFVGRRLLQHLICGTQDVISCLPSPRLYTSVAAGLKVTLPLVLVGILIGLLLQSRIIRRCFRAFGERD